MKEAEFAAEAITKRLGEVRNGTDPFEECIDATIEGQDAIHDVIDTFWECP